MTFPSQPEWPGVPDPWTPRVAAPPPEGRVTIVTAGLPELPRAGAVPRSLPVPASLPAATQSSWFDVLEEDLAAGPVVVVCLAPAAAQTTRAVSVARQLLETSQITVVPVPGAPLAAAVAACAAAEATAAGALASGDVARFVTAAVAGVIDVGVVSSVADLDLPGLSLSHHVASYLPGKTQFLVQMTPVQQVERLRSDTVPQGEALTLLAPGTWTATAMGSGSLPVSLVGWLQARGLAHPAVLPADEAMTTWWRSTTALELVLHPTSGPEWARHVLAAGRGATATCDWCGAHGVIGVCQFCGQQLPQG